MPRGTFFRSLAEDHERSRDLFTTIAVEQDAQEIAKLSGDLERILRIHLELEESLVYPALHQVARDREDHIVIHSAQEDHRLILEALGHLREDDKTGSARYQGKIHALERLWAHHTEEEESNVFSLARKLLDLAGFTQLSDRLVARREELEGRPTPKVPHHE